MRRRKRDTGHEPKHMYTLSDFTWPAAGTKHADVKLDAVSGSGCRMKLGRTRVSLSSNHSNTPRSCEVT